VNKSSSILITGGAGFIGSHLANNLYNLGFTNLTCIDNLSAGNWERLNPRIVKVEYDIGNSSEDRLKSILQKTEVVFHLSAVKLHNNLNSFDEMLNHNIVATEKMLRISGEVGIKTFVFTSSLYTYGLPSITLISEDTPLEPTTFYGASKVMGEQLVKLMAIRYGFDYSIARLFFIYGENQYAFGGYKSVIVRNFERLIKGKPAIVHGDGLQVLDYLHVSDCVTSLIGMANNPTNTSLNVASGIPITILELTSTMIEIFGNGSFLHAESDWTAGTSRVGSNKRLQNMLSWNAKIDLRQGLARTLGSMT
jgi:UDP-glucose 4-epimerase